MLVSQALEIKTKLSFLRFYNEDIETTTTWHVIVQFFAPPVGFYFR